jgi:hypothetical protein
VEEDWSIRIHETSSRTAEKHREFDALEKSSKELPERGIGS